MSEPTNPQPAQQPSPPGDQHPTQRPRRKWATIVATVIGGLAVFTIGYATGTATTEPSSSTTAQKTPAPATSYAAPSTYDYAASRPLPKPSDFTIDVKILEKKCYGSAGCLVRYRIEPTHVGSSPLTDPKIMSGTACFITRRSVSGAGLV